MRISLETKVRILYLMKNEGISSYMASKRCGILSATGNEIYKRRNEVKKLIFECSKMIDGGLPYLMWPELMSMKKNERETEADLRKRIKYLEAKVAYYEELSKLKGIQKKCNYSFGYRKMSDWLRTHENVSIGRNSILRLMRENRLLSCVRRRRFTEEQYEARRLIRQNIPENLLERDFSVSESGRKYVCDITYLQGIGITKYLATVEDLYNGEIVAWKIGFHPDRQLCMDCIEMLARTRDVSGAVIHSDEGSSYLSLDYRFLLHEKGMIQSCSARGQCWDNAPMESFNGVLKTECLYNRFGKTAVKNHRIPINLVEEAVSSFIEFYNTERPKERLGGLSPSQFRMRGGRTV
jgi:transposase InsO family protein